MNLEQIKNNKELQLFLEQNEESLALELSIELFKARNFDFIVKGIANNSEGDFERGKLATHEKQKKALNILTNDNYDEFMYGGAAGGAKTWTGCCWLGFMAKIYPDTNWFVARKTLKDLLDSVLPTFNDVFKTYGITDYKFNGKYNYIEFENGSKINFIEVTYLPTDPMFERLGSKEYTGGWIEEVGEIHRKAYSVLSTRIGRKHNDKYKIKRKLYMTCNPKQNWAKDEFYDKHISGLLYEENEKVLPNGEKVPQRIFLECLAIENPHLSQDYINNLYNQAERDPASYQRLFKANWDYEDNPNQLADQEMIDGVFDNHLAIGGKTYLTADVAFQGSDKAVIVVWKGWIVKEIRTFDISDTKMQVASILELSKRYRIPKSRCIADGDGGGKGVVDMSGVKSFRNGSKPIRMGKENPNYRNLQVQCLYLLADRINDGSFGIEADISKERQRDIKVELAQIQSAPNKRDSDKLSCKIKDQIRQDIGRSPDYRDAFLMRVFFDLKRLNLNLTTTWS